MDNERCKELLEEYRTAIMSYKEAEQAAKQSVITDPLKPENMPPTVGGIPQDDTDQKVKNAKERLMEAEKAYRECIDDLS